MLKKTLLSLLLAVFALGVFYSPTFAEDGPWYAPTYEQFNRKVQDSDESEIFGERYTQAQVYWIFYSLQNVLVNSGFLDCISQGTSDATTIDDASPVITTCVNEIAPSPVDDGGTASIAPSGNYSKNPGVLLGLAGFVDGIRNTKPASGVEYIAQNLQKFDIVPTAYAQGFGFQSLSATQSLWTATRNMAFGLMVLVFIVLAFMIMFRVKLSPQVTITVQSALPKIIIAMVLIWFSYAIAGLLIDLAYLVQGIVAAFIKTTATPAGDLSQRTVLQFLQIMNTPSYGILSIGLLLSTLVTLTTIFFGGITVASGGIALVPMLLIAGIVFLVLLVIFVIALVRIIWLFLNTYVKLLLLIVFGPFMILGGAINMGGITTWIKSIVAQLSVFVAASVLIVIAHIFIWGSGFTGNPGLSGVEGLNPFLIRSGAAAIGGVQVPGLDAQNTEIIGFIIGLVVILGIPNLASLVRDTIQKPLRFELGLGQNLGPASVRGGAVMYGGERIAERFGTNSAAGKAISTVASSVAKGLR